MRRPPTRQNGRQGGSRKRVLGGTALSERWSASNEERFHFSALGRSAHI